MHGMGPVVQGPVGFEQSLGGTKRKADHLKRNIFLSDVLGSESRDMPARSGQPPGVFDGHMLPRSEVNISESYPGPKRPKIVYHQQILQPASSVSTSAAHGDCAQHLISEQRVYWLYIAIWGQN
jgi:hypothetical protein